MNNAAVIRREIQLPIVLLALSHDAACTRLILSAGLYSPGMVLFARKPWAVSASNLMTARLKRSYSKVRMQTGHASGTVRMAWDSTAHRHCRY